MSKKRVIFFVMCTVTIGFFPLSGNAAMKAIRASFALRIRALEWMRIGNAFAKAAQEVSPEEYKEVKRDVETMLSTLRKQRNKAFALQREIKKGEELLAPKGGKNSFPLSNEEFQKVRKKLKEDKKTLDVLMLEKKV